MWLGRVILGFVPLEVFQPCEIPRLCHRAFVQNLLPFCRISLNRIISAHSGEFKGNGLWHPIGAEVFSHRGSPRGARVRLRTGPSGLQMANFILQI